MAQTTLAAWFMMTPIMAAGLTKRARVVMAAGIFLFVTGSCLFARPAYRFVRRMVVQWKSSRMWDDWKKTGKESHSGDPIAWLTAKDAQLDSMVLRGASKKNLYTFPCWTTMGTHPGNKGLRIIIAHRDIHFRRLGNLIKGSVVNLETIHGTSRYRVVETQILEPERACQLIEQSVENDRLLLMTCYPFKYIGPAPERYLVWSAPVQSSD